jgi:hypothetical protein
MQHVASAEKVPARDVQTMHTRAGRAPSDSGTSVTLSEIQLLTQAFASSAVGSAAKRRQYSLTSIGRDSAALDISNLCQGTAPSRGPATLGNDGEGDWGQSGDNLEAGSSAGGQGGVVAFEPSSSQPGWHHLDAVKRLNAMLSQLDSKDRNALKLRASQL